MVRLLTIIGARPQIIKAAALSRVIKNQFASEIEEIILHTGQHYDENMSQVFIEEMQIPEPDYNLNAGSGTHGKQTAKMIEGIEKVILKEHPDYVVLYGDTNSTLAGALAGTKLHIPVIHIEAGLRSFNKSMPEEINRITCDHASTLLFSPTKTGFENLIHEGFNPGNKPPYTIDNPKIYHCGDIMFDNCIFFSEIAKGKSTILEKLKVNPEQFILGTIHRDHNTDNPEKLTSVFKAIDKISKDHAIDVVLPLHPRTKKLLRNNLSEDVYNSIQRNERIIITEPVSFLDMIMLESNCKLIMTDSGGVQKESYFYEKPCIILRPQTEWVEIVDNGTAIITDTDEEIIYTAFKRLTKDSNLKFPPVFGDGKTAEFICNEILGNFETTKV